jgi:hypothetical protein
MTIAVGPVLILIMLAPAQRSAPRCSTGKKAAAELLGNREA